MGGYFRACNGSAGVAKRSSGGGLLDCAGDWGCAGCAELDARLSAGTDERVGGHMLRAVRVGRGRAPGRRRDQASGMVGLGRENRRVITLPALREGRADLSRRHVGASPSGKATDFDSVIRRFDPSRPSHQRCVARADAVRRNSLIAASTFCQRSNPVVSPC
jgi:hypothetical protein